MTKATLFCIDGFEEIEALTVVDIFRRAGIGIDICSVNASSDLILRGKHDIVIQADTHLSEFDPSVDMIVIPGGTTAYLDNLDLLETLSAYYKSGKKMAAICAAPAVFAELGILDGKTATIYPGMENYLVNSVHSTDDVVTDGLITTSRGPATAMEFALELVRILKGDKALSVLMAELLF